MFRKALLALALLFASAPAFAQNTTCADRPATDSSNACANTRFVQSHTDTVVVPISAYGAKCDNSTDDTTSIQNAWNAAAAIGSNVWLGGVGVGICKISSLTMPTPTGTGKASFLTGPGSGSVKLSSSVTGTTCAITSTVTYGVNSYIEGAFSGFEIAQASQGQTGYGFCATNWTKGNFVDVKFSWFFRGFSGIDVTSIGFLNSTFFDNQIGAYGAMVTNTPPNDWSFIDNKFQNNGKNSISLTGPNLANISFNEFQAGGYNTGQAPTATIDIIGPPGGPVVGANINNNYFEANDGSAEIRINQSSVANGVGVYNITNNTIVRAVTTQAAGILVINSGTGTAKTTVNVSGNGFYDNTGISAGFLWLSASTAGTTNYIFNCTGSNRADISAEMPTLCQNNVANTVPMVDANAQYIGYGTKAQLTALVNLATATLPGTVPAFPNNTTTFFRGDGTYAAPTAGSVTGGLPLTKTDDTNVTLTLGGTPSTALLQATSITVGWTGTLAAARLNSNVVQSVVNDTNVTGTISAQALTLGWTGTLAAGRLNANVVQAITNDTNITGSITAQNLTLAWAGTLANARLATMATNTVKGNATSGTASPTDLAVGSCSTSSSALIWTTNTGFGCNTAIVAASATSATNATNIAITDDTTTNATMDLTWVTTNTGNLPAKVSSTKLNWNPSTGAFSSPLAVHSTSVSSPIHLSSGALTFQSNGSTFAGSISTGQLWYLGGTSLTPAAGTTLTVSQNTGGTPATSAIGNILGQFIAADTVIGTVVMDTFGAQGVMASRYAGGTQTSKSAVAGSTTTFSFSAQAWDAVSAYNTFAAIDFQTLNLQSTSDHSGSVRFRTVASGATALAEAGRFNPSGCLSVGAATDCGSGNIISVGHLLASGTAPTISSCGVSPSISGGDNFGTVNAGTGILASCVVNFGKTWGTAPRCVASSSTAIASMTVSATTTQLTIGGTSLTGDAINWVCGSTS